MRILIGNDDGYRAPGLKALALGLAAEHEVWVAAPQKECSATSHGLTLREILRVERHEEGGVVFHGVSGLPADAMKYGLSVLCAGQPPDVVLSGINHGANTGQNLFYSGTVAAAAEGAFAGLPAMAVSVAAPFHVDPARGFASAVAVVRHLLACHQRHPVAGGTLLNVNVPNRPLDELRGLRVSRMGYARFHEIFVERLDPNGRPYFWMDGAKPQDDPEPDHDDHQVHAGWVSVTPLELDLTHPAWDRLLAPWQLDPLPREDT